MTDSAVLHAEEQGSLEAVIKGEVLRMYQDVAEHPEGEFHFHHGRRAAEMSGNEREWLDPAPPGAVASFAGVGNPHLRSRLEAGEVVLDVGSGAGLDSIIAAWQVGPAGRVVGVDLNPTMCRKAEAHAAASGVRMACHEGRMEDIPLPDASVDVVISNGVINLSFRKRTVIRELFRVLKPGGRLAITDIVSAKQLSQSIANEGLRELLERGSPVTVLDVRPAAERAEWSIPGSVHADAYDALRRGDSTALADFHPTNGGRVVTVCAAGKTSMLAAERLRARGLNAVSLEGGMRAWSLAWNTAEVSCPGSTARIVQLGHETRSEEHTSELQSPCNLVC